MKAEDRFRGELIYEYLEDSSGIRVKWKHILQRSDCNTVRLKFFVDNLLAKEVSHEKHRDIYWVEIKAEKTFELKIEAHYKTEPKCFQASKTINMNPVEGASKEKVHGTLPDLKFTVALEPEETTTLAVTENNVVMNETALGQEGGEGGSDEAADTVIIACSVGGSAIVLVVVIALSLRKSRSSAKNSPEEVDDNPDYGIYSDNPDDDCVTFEDNNENYYASD